MSMDLVVGVAVRKRATAISDTLRSAPGSGSSPAQGGRRPGSRRALVLAAAFLMLAAPAPALAGNTVRAEEHDTLPTGSPVAMPCVRTSFRGNYNGYTALGERRLSNFTSTTLSGPVSASNFGTLDCEPTQVKLTMPGEYVLVTTSAQSGERVICNAEDPCDGPDGEFYWKWADAPDLSYYIVHTTKFTVEGKPNRFSPNERAGLALGGENLDALLIGYGACAVVPKCSVFGGVGTAITATVKFVVGKLAKDPPVGNFRAIQDPERLKAPAVLGGGGNAAQSLDRLIANETQLVAQGRALRTAVDRAGGAKQARSRAWEVKQMQAAGRFAVQMAALLRGEPSLRKLAVAELKRSGIGASQGSPEQVAVFRTQVAQHGLPVDIVNALKALHTPANEIEDIRFTVAAGGPTTPTDAFPDNLTAPGQLSALARAASALESFARHAQRFR